MLHLVRYTGATVRCIAQYFYGHPGRAMRMSMPRIACQLYTVREIALRDFSQALRAVRNIGYTAVEIAGYGSLGSASEVRKALDSQEMSVAASHTNIDALERSLPRLLDDCDTLGTDTLVLSFLPEPRRQDARGWQTAGRLLDGIGRACAERGVELAYHHHHFEFQKFDGKYGLEILWESTDPAFLKAELDTFWLRYAGIDPVKYLNRLGSRTRLIHLKDVIAGPPTRFGEVGAGILDFPAILATAKTVGVRWGVVEQDSTYERPPLESLRMSYEKLVSLGAC